MRRFTPALVLLLVACSEQSFNKTDGSTSGSGPAIQVTPTYLDFGSLSSGDDAMVLTFTNSNDPTNFFCAPALSDISASNAPRRFYRLLAQ